MVNKNKILLMLSGGADSVALLAKLLRETDSPIYAHHINYKNILGRDIAEQPASNACVAFCRQHYRNFEFTSSTIDLEFLNGINFPDVMHTSYIAGQIVIDDSAIGEVAKVAIADDYTDPNDHNVSTRIELAKNMFNLLVPKESSPTFSYRVKHMTKKNILESMPVELAKLTWSCRVPVQLDERHIQRCGTCRTCKQILDCLPTQTGLTRKWFFEEINVARRERH
jgi:7-cyano-7-deazaguanine synthase in queuosine biosynthesis